jgi:hypothetical protein
MITDRIDKVEEVLRDCRSMLYRLQEHDRLEVLIAEVRRQLWVVETLLRFALETTTWDPNAFGQVTEARRVILQVQGLTLPTSDVHEP